MKTKENILLKLDSITFDFRLCHGDFHPFNLILSKEEKVKVIDWVDASSGIFAQMYFEHICCTHNLR